MRLVGRRVASQYTLIALSAVIALAGTIGAPLLSACALGAGGETAGHR